MFAAVVCLLISVLSVYKSVLNYLVHINSYTTYYTFIHLYTYLRNKINKTKNYENKPIVK